MVYEADIVENLLRYYHSLPTSPESTFCDYKVDIDIALPKLKQHSIPLHDALVGVFTNGVPIQEQADIDGVSRMQIHRRLYDGLHLMTMIMNGEF